MDSETIFDRILEREGGFVDNPHDRGGPTKYGITLDTLRDFRGADVTREDVRQLTEEAARRIYRIRYMAEPGYDGIHNATLRALVVDSGVNHGTARATRWLQRAAGTTVDGIVGPKTLRATNEGHTTRIYLDVLRMRAEFYGEIITEDPEQARFAHGWMRRLGEFMRQPVAHDR